MKKRWFAGDGIQFWPKALRKATIPKRRVFSSIQCSKRKRPLSCIFWLGMEAMGRDGGGGPSWSYRRHEETGSGSSSYTISSSSRSGTIVSTTYTSGGSGLSSSISAEAPLLQLELQLDVDTSGIEADKKDAVFDQPIKKPRKETGETLKEKMKYMERLVQEFFRAPSANCSILGGDGMDVHVLERWLSELGVSWVLQLDVGASALVLGHATEREIWSWIRALTQIMETIRLTASFFSDHGHGFVGMPGISEEEVELPPESGKQATSLDPVQFALFFQEAMSKMLVFVDFVFSKSLSTRGPLFKSNSLYSFPHIHSALSKALSEIRLQFHSSPPAEVEKKKIEEEMVSLLSAKQGKAFDGIWSALEESRTRVLKSMEDSLGTETPQGSSDIHEATCSVMNHIKFLLGNHWAVDPLVSQAVSLGKYVPQTGLGVGEAPPFISLITEMVSCLEEKLITKSQLFLDKGLGLLFLLNNSNFIPEQLIKYRFSYIKDDVAAVISFINRKVEHYTESYIQVSWEPMLACLFNPTPLRLLRKYSPLSKFESEFHKIYTTQKLWKVPDPELRKRLRKSVIEQIIPGYTRYIEDSKVTNPKFTPQELEEMLQELFEG